MSNITGQALDGDALLAQRIADVLTTPIGSRVMRRDYGSLLTELTDGPVNSATLIQLYAATAGALMTWIGDLALTRVQFAAGDRPGAFVLRLLGRRTDLPGRPETDITLSLRRTPAGLTLA